MVASVLERDTVCAAGSNTVGTICRCCGGLHRLLEGFPCGKRGDRFGRNLDGVACAGVASFTRLAVTETEAPKTTQFHVVSRVQRLHNPLQETRDDRVGLVLRERSEEHTSELQSRENLV